MCHWLCNITLSSNDCPSFHFNGFYTLKGADIIQLTYGTHFQRHYNVQTNNNEYFNRYLFHPEGTSIGYGYLYH